VLAKQLNNTDKKIGDQKYSLSFCGLYFNPSVSFTDNRKLTLGCNIRKAVFFYKCLGCFGLPTYRNMTKL